MGMTLCGGGLVVVSTGSALSLFHESYLLWGQAYSSGGAVGIPFADFLVRYTNVVGCVMILVLLFALGFVLTTGISMVTVFVFFKTADCFALMFVLAGGAKVIVGWCRAGILGLRNRREQRIKNHYCRARKIGPAVDSLSQETLVRQIRRRRGRIGSG